MFTIGSEKLVDRFAERVNADRGQLGGGDSQTVQDGRAQIGRGGRALGRVLPLAVGCSDDVAAATLLADLLRNLKSAQEGGETLLDRTMVLYGSNLGDANAHSTTNLPTILAGGGFRHGQHLAFDRARNYPLPNLFVSILRRLGIEEAGFGPSTGTMTGLEMV